MCCFSVPHATVGLFSRLLGRGPSVRVSGTKIFARVENGIQELVYSMSVTTPGDVAMVLPLPIALGSGESALRFVDLSGYDTFFDDLAQLFFMPMVASVAKGLQQSRAAAPKLVVHNVGSFEASFVPTIADFDRLDPRFRLPTQIWDQKREYARFGFAVFKLKKGKSARIHPMAMRFPTAEPSSIFFPTLHVHDGKLRERAKFEHHLYFQMPRGGEPELFPPGDDPSWKHTGRSYDAAKSKVRNRQGAGFGGWRRSRLRVASARRALERRYASEDRAGRTRASGLISSTERGARVLRAHSRRRAPFRTRESLAIPRWPGRSATSSRPIAPG